MSADSRTTEGMADVEGGPSPTGSARHTIHIKVEVEPHKPPVTMEFATSQVTGRAIKDEAGVPLENDLARRDGQKLELVTNDETITIANGDRFVSLPPGTIS